MPSSILNTPSIQLCASLHSAPQTWEVSAKLHHYPPYNSPSPWCRQKAGQWSGHSCIDSVTLLIAPISIHCFISYIYCRLFGLRASFLFWVFIVWGPTPLLGSLGVITTLWTHLYYYELCLLHGLRLSFLIQKLCDLGTSFQVALACFFELQ